MIHLDTNFLIGLLVKGSPQAREVDERLAAGQAVAALKLLVLSDFFNSQRDIQLWDAKAWA